MRRFKLFFMCMVLVTCMLGSSASVNASSYSTGKAVIPSFLQSLDAMSIYFVSNITDCPIDVTVTFYNPDGTILIDDNNQSTGKVAGFQMLNYKDQNTDSTLTFTLNAHCTGYFHLQKTPQTNFGYGIIQWKQESTALQGLVVSAYYLYAISGDSSRFTIPVNNGMPF